MEKEELSVELKSSNLLIIHILGRVIDMVSQQDQQLLNQAQIYQQQIQSVLTQKESFNMQLLEVNKALEEIDKTNEANVYKVSGPILIKSSKKDVKKELSEKKELIETRIKTLDRSEKALKAKIEELRDKLTKSSKPEPGAG